MGNKLPTRSEEPVSEAKPEEVKAEEAKPEEAKPEEAKPEEAKPEEVTRLTAPTQKSYERCNKACCATALWVSDASDVEVLVPLKDVSIHARIDSGIIK